MYGVPGRTCILPPEGGSQWHKALEGQGQGWVQVVGSSHSSDETCESRWSEGEDISFVSFDETLGTLEAPLQVESEEKEIWELSGTHKRLQTLIHHVNKDSLKEEHQRQSGNKASGIDGVTKADYSRNLDDNIDDLLKRMKTFSYRPKPARRTYIPKLGGKKRPLGIPSYEDKLVQGVMAKVLNDVYEPRFMNSSYGFRPNRSCHDVIRDINSTIGRQPIGWVVEADIKGYFDNIDHSWLMKFLEHDIQDKNFLRYIVRFLKAGIMEDGQYLDSESGSPQGGIISPILANVYLHYVLDIWFEKMVKPRMRGKAYLYRYADDFLALFEFEDDARKYYEVLPRRLGKFNLEVAQEKTRLIPFGRNSGSKDTFDFLGFTHINGKTRNGCYRVMHRTSKKKLIAKRQAMKQWLRLNMHNPVRDIIRGLNLRLMGHYRYYGISGNSKSLDKYHYYCVTTLFKVLRRRGQKRKINWTTYRRIINAYGIAKPRICVDIWH
jgi:group II intron reverse transcriptase/maturase